MSSSKDPLKYTIMTELFPVGSTKSQRTQLMILEAAVASYEKHGLDKTTFETISQIAGVSRPLVRHYFESLDILFATVAKFIRAELQNLAVSFIEKADDPITRIENYVQSCFVWATQMRSHSSVWLAFWYKCSIDKELHSINSQLAEIGQLRIEKMLMSIHSKRQLSNADLTFRAKAIQVMIMGMIVMIHTEKLPMNETDYARLIVRQCRAIAEASPEN